MKAIKIPFYAKNKIGKSHHGLPGGVFNVEFSAEDVKKIKRIYENGEFDIVVKNHEGN